MSGFSLKNKLKKVRTITSYMVTGVLLLSLISQGLKADVAMAAVDVPVTSVTVSPVALSLGIGTTNTLAAEVRPHNATNKRVVWSSNSTSTATVNADTGQVTALAVGEAEITATTVDGNFKASSIVTVVTLVTGINLLPSSVNVNVGETLDLDAEIIPSAAHNRDVIWSSGNTSVATVDQTGGVTGRSAGTAVITATSREGEFTDTRTIIVSTVQVTGVSITSTVTEVSVNRSLQLTANVYPANATNRQVTWSSSHPLIATVDQSGLVTGQSQGSVIITARTVDGMKTATSTITVSRVLVTKVYVSPISVTMLVNTNSKLTTRILPENASDLRVTWASSNNSVATVDSSGLVTARATGEAIITATALDGNHRDTSRVTVGARVTGVTLSPGTINFRLNDPPQQLTARVIPSDAHDQRVVWTSSNIAVATVDNNGLVTRTAASGTATITARTVDGGHTASAVATIIAAPVTGVTLTPSSPAPIVVGATQQLTAAVVPANATVRSVTWTSSNAAVATVSATGLVRGIGGGTAKITVTTLEGGFTASVDITVNVISVTGITIAPATATVNVGATQQLTATIAPANASNRNVTWSSSDSSVAAVSDTGLVSGLRAGIATITARTADGGRTAGSVITVNFIPVTGITVLPANAAIRAGFMLQLNASIVPANASNRSLMWTSSNTSVASVNETGLVAGIGQGTAVITARTVDGARTAATEIQVTAVTVTGVTLTPISAAIAEGSTQQLTATVEPSIASNRQVTWTSSNAAVATVNAAGLVTGVRAGTATITVRTADGGRTAVSQITVTGEGPPLRPSQHNAVTQPVARGRTTLIQIENALEVTISPNAVAGQLAAVTAWVVPDDEASPIITKAQRQELAPLSSVVMLGLSGGEFVAPVSVTLQFDQERITAGIIPAIFVYNDRTDRWVYIGGNRAGGGITALVERFSMFAVFAVKPLPAMNDISVHWGGKPIITLAGMNIVGGYPDGNFRPDARVTRAEFAAMLTRALGLEARLGIAGRFTDAALVDWAKGAIGATVDEGLMRGFPDGSFGAQRGITRAEIAVILDRVVSGNHVRVEATGIQARFADEIPAWAAAGVQATARAGLIGGFQDNTFRPGQTATRAEVAAMLYRLIAR